MGKENEANALMEPIDGGVFCVRYYFETDKFAFEYASNGFLKLLHYSQEEFGNLEKEGRLQNVIYADDRDDCIKTMKKRACDNWEEFNYFRLVNKEGKVVWVQVTGIVQKEEENVLVKYVVSDISPLVNSGESVEGYDDVDGKIAKYSFDVLEGTRDLSVAISTIMSNVGKHFDLRYVTIRWIDEVNGKFILAQQWKESSEMNDLSPIHYYSKEVMAEYLEDLSSNVLILQGVDRENAKDYLKVWMDDSKAKAFLQSPIYEGDRIAGVISFIGAKEDRRWTKKEIKTLQLMARIISAHTMGSKTKSEIDERVKDLTSYDPLTGLLTMTEFKNRAQKILEENDGKQKLAVIYSDFTNFKSVNDTLGMGKGDKVLMDFADFIKGPDVCIAAARDYADSMITLVYAPSEEMLYQAVSAANLSFCTEQNKLHPEIDFNISSGVYIFGNDEKNINAGIDNANIARKIVKKEKMHGVMFFESHMLEDIKRQAKIVSDFKGALHEGEFLLYLQPQMDINTETITGAEALVRWRKRDGQFVYPDQFIPVLEKSGGIIELDFYMLEKTLKFLVKWKAEGAALFPISVNFSRIHLFNPEFAKKLYSKIKEYGVDPKYIDIEITESVFVKEYDRVVENLNYLREKGISVSIDDFGTGYSSLNVLTQVAVDTIKIDKTFLDGAEKSYATQCVVEYIIALARKLNLGIICEGVETERQLKMLKDANCKIVQGYYYDKPIDEANFEKKYME